MKGVVLRKPSRQRRLAMTSLIDVIFLLLLFFMLSTTFTNFSEINLQLGSKGEVTHEDRQLAFLQLRNDEIALNGHSVTLEVLTERLIALETSHLVVSPDESANAQNLVDLLAELKKLTKINVVLLGEER